MALTQAQLFGRIARVIVSFPTTVAGDYSGLAGQDMIFNATSDPDQPGMRIAFEIKGLKVELQAGYVGTGMSRIFIGDVRTSDSVRNGADWDATLRLGDG